MASRSLGSLTVDLIAKIGGFSQGMDKAARAADTKTKEIERRVNKMSESLRNTFGGIAKTLAAAFAVHEVVRFTKSLADAQIEAQKIQFTMQQAFGPGAGTQIAFVTALSEKLGLSLQTAEQAFAELGASAQGTSVTVADLQQLFTGMSEASTVLHTSAVDVAGVYTQLAQGISLGKLQMQDIRAIAQHLPGTMVILQRAAKDMGTSLKDALAHGGLDAAQALKYIGIELHKTFGPNALAASHSLNAELNRFHSTLFAVQTGATGLEESFAAAMRSVNDALKDPEVIRGVQDMITGFGAAIATVATHLGALKTVLGGVAIAGHVLAEAFYVVKAAVETVAISTGMLIDQAIAAAKAMGDLATLDFSGAKEQFKKYGQASEAASGAVAASWKKAHDDIKKSQFAVFDILSGNKLKAPSPVANIGSPGFGVKKPKEGPTAAQLAKSAAAAKAAARAAAAAAKTLSDSYAALFTSVNTLKSADDPTKKIVQDYATGVANLAKLGGAVIKAGGDVATVQEQVATGVIALQKKMRFDLAAPAREVKQYTDGLDAQTRALKESIDVRVQSIGLGSKEADSLQELARVRFEGAEAITKLTQEFQLQGKADTPEFAAKLQATKDYWAGVYAATQEGQQRIDKATGDWHKGVTAALQDFMDSQANMYEQAKQITASMVDGFSGAFTSFVSGAESAKQAFGSFIDSMYQQALKFLANKTIQALFDSFGVAGKSQTPGSTAGGFASLLGNFANDFGFSKGGGLANGGLVTPRSFHQILENGPEIYSQDGKSYLMGGGRPGNVIPLHTNDSGSRYNVTNVYVQPTSTRRTADQVATAVARKQRTASVRNG